MSDLVVDVVLVLLPQSSDCAILLGKGECVLAVAIAHPYFQAKYNRALNSYDVFIRVFSSVVDAVSQVG